MKFLSQKIPDLILIKPKVHEDIRGCFTETFRQDLLEKKLGYQINFVQDNESISSKGVLRGLHYQLPPFAQSKLVRVIKGSVLDVAVDIRLNSPTFGQHLTVELSEKNKQQIYIPKGFAHGFIVLSNTAIFTYKMDNYYAPDYERGIAFDDEQLAIDWVLPKKDLQLSDKDKCQPNFSYMNDYPLTTL